MRELNPDGTIKNIQAYYEEYGISIGSTLMRKSDKSKCKVIALFADKCQVSSLDSKSQAYIPIQEVLQGQWSRCQDDENRDIEYTPKVAKASLFELSRIATELHEKLCALAVEHDSCLSGIKISGKPKGIVAVSNFQKHKLVLVPWSFKVFGGREAPKNSLQLSVPFEHTSNQYWIKPLTAAPKSNDEVVVPYWFMSTHSSDFNMEVFMMKCDDYKIPVARNIRPITQGEPLVLEGLQSHEAASSLFEPAPAIESDKDSATRKGKGSATGGGKGSATGRGAKKPRTG